MKTKIKFLVFLFLIALSGYSQSFINIDLGNSILLRPNLGYERRFKKMAIGGNLRWQRNAFIWISEFPGFMKTNGINLDLTFRNLNKRYVYTEAGIRFTSFKGQFLERGWQIVSLYNSDRRIEPFLKFGINSNRNKKFQADLGIGVGCEFSTKSLQISDSDTFDSNYFPLTDNQLKLIYKKPKGIQTGIKPHAQLRFFYEIGK
jgi:hypothetical protein